MTDTAQLTSDFLEVRRQLTSAQRRSSFELRHELAVATKQWLAGLADELLPADNYSLIAVGGLGRDEVCAGSDLDLLLLHTHAAPDVAEVADRLWYPLWDSGLKLDHSVRNPAQARAMAGQDFKVLLGLLDAQVIWGDTTALQQLRQSVLADWRAHAAKRLPELRESVMERRQRAGELAHLLEPDLKDSYGGLRELTVLRAISASWLTDIQHGEFAAANRNLLQVRDALHRTTGRASDKLSMQEQAAVAELQGFESDDELLRHVSMNARSIATASDLAWYRVNRLLQSQGRVRKLLRREDVRRPLADGVVAQDGEVVLAIDADPAADSGLALRAAAAAAQAGLILSPHTVNRLEQESKPLPVPWPAELRDSLVSLLGAGPSMVPIWEALDQAGLIERILPRWSQIRSLPQRNALHIYTVDRHSLQCAVEASRLARMVERPDLLLVAALFHDIGKGGAGHCERGAALMRVVAPTLGFDAADTEVLVCLVRHHLLLAETAVSRDPDDPATVAQVVNAVGDARRLELLHALTIADSKAASPSVLTAWKERLIADLVQRASAALIGAPVPPTESLAARFPMAITGEIPQIAITGSDKHAVISLKAADRIGLLATVAGALALQRLEVRVANIETVEGIALQEWEVHPAFGQLPATDDLQRELLRALSHSAEISERLATLQPLVRSRGFVPPPPRVRLLPDASTRATVLEVRAHDAPALLHRVAASIAMLGATVISARASTLGSEVVDVLYLQSDIGLPLSDAAAAEVVAAVAARLTD